MNASQVYGLTMRLFADCVYDRVQVWHIVRGLRELEPGLAESDYRRLAIGIIEDLLYTGLVKAGDPETWADNFREWPGTTDEILERIRNEVNGLEQEAGLSEVVSLEANDDAIRMFNHMIPRAPGALLPEPTRLPPHRRTTPGH
jgi:hypothetical protein